MDIEYTLDFIAKKCKNVYLVAVFGCGRRVYDSKRHTGFLSKEEASLRYEIFNRILGTVGNQQEEKKEAESSDTLGGLLKKTTSIGGYLKKKTSVAKSGAEKYNDEIRKITLIYCSKKE